MTELSGDEVRGLVREIALATIGRGKFIDVRSAETTDLDGDRALDITVVLTSEEVHHHAGHGNARRSSQRTAAQGR